MQFSTARDLWLCFNSAPAEVPHAVSSVVDRLLVQEGDKVQILAGVRPGEEVVIQGGMGVDDKAKVKIIDTSVKESAEEDEEETAEPAGGKDQKPANGKDQKKAEAKPKAK